MARDHHAAIPSALAIMERLWYPKRCRSRILATGSEEAVAHMSDEFAVSRSSIVLGEAMRPVSRKIEQRMGDAPARKGSPDDPFRFVTRHLDRLEEHTKTLGGELNGELNCALAPGTDETEIRRIAARMEMHIERILDDYDDVRCMHGETRDARALSLLEDIYRKLLGLVREVLADLFEAVDDPAAASRKRGQETEGQVVCTTALTLEVSQELDGLGHWLKQRADGPVSDRRDERVDSSDGHQDIGFFRLVLLALGLSWLFG